MKSITMQVAEWIEQQESFTVKDIEKAFQMSCREASGCLQYTKRIGYKYKKERLFGNSFRYSLESIELKEKVYARIWLPESLKAKLSGHKQIHEITGMDMKFCHQVWRGEYRLHRKYVEMLNKATSRKELMKLALGI